jgi:YfiR/HmsC-like
MPSRRRLQARLMLASCLVASALAVGAEGTRTLNEYSVKAAFLYNFVLYTDWPPEAFSGPDAPLVIGVLGDDPYGGLLDRALPSKRVKGRALEVRRVGWDGGVLGCHVVFLAASETRRIGELLQQIDQQSVLSVCDTTAAAERGCVIGFMVADARVGFDINTASASKARLSISSRVLALARKRLDGPRSGS